MTKSKWPIYLVTGDSYEREQEIQRIISSYFSSASSEDQPVVTRYFSDEFDIREVLTKLQTFPLFGSKQAILIKRIERLKKEAKESLLSYLERPNDFTLLILEGEKCDKRESFFQAIQDKGTVQDFSRPGWAQRPSFVSLIKNKVRSAGKEIEPQAAKLLDERCGDNLFVLDDAIEKIILYAADKKVLSVDVVQVATKEFFLSQQYDLTDSLLDKNPAVALRVFHNLLQTRASNAVSVVGIINWQLKRIWRAKRLTEQGIDAQSIGKQLSIPPRYLKTFLKSVGRFSPDAIEQALEKLYELDVNIKRGIADPVRGMETLIVEVTK